MKIRRHKKPKSDGHYFVRAKTIPVWICVAEHACDEVRNIHGQPILWSARKASAEA